MKGWKIVQLVALVREDDAADLHSTYGQLTEHDESKAAYVETRDLTGQEELEFGEVISDYNEALAE